MYLRPILLNHQHKELIYMIQLPPYRLHKLGIVMVPRWIPAVLRREPPWDKKKYHKLQSSEMYFFKYDENQDFERSSKPIVFSLFTGDLSPLIWYE